MEQKYSEPSFYLTEKRGQLSYVRHNSREEVSALVLKTLETPVPHSNVNPCAAEKDDAFLLSLPSASSSHTETLTEKLVHPGR